MMFTKEEKDLIEYAKKRVFELCKLRKSKEFHDTLYAFVLSESGKIYGGVPLECFQPNGSCCAERIALANMRLAETEKAKAVCILISDPAPNKKIKATMPCGTCRSVFTEFAKEDATVLCTSFIRKKDNWEIFARIDKYKARELYPHPYIAINWN